MKPSFRHVALVLSVLAGLCCQAATAFSASSFLLVERPGRLLVYNKYQQSIDERQRAQLVPFVPMRIVRANDFLGDGFTPCMTVEVHGNLFYIVRGKDGALSGADEAGAIRRVNDVDVLADTVVIHAQEGYTLAAPVGDAQRRVRRGARLARYFRDGGKIYVGTVDQPPRYGFIQLPAPGGRNSWEIDRSTDEDGPTTIPQQILEAVQEDIGEVNRVYRGLYDFFNKQTGQQRPVPYWKMASTRKAIICTLMNRPARADVSQSTRYLVKDLENAVLGMALRVSSTADRIEIRMEQAE